MQHERARDGIAAKTPGPISGLLRGAPATMVEFPWAFMAILVLVTPLPWIAAYQASYSGWLSASRPMWMSLLYVLVAVTVILLAVRAMWRYRAGHATARRHHVRFIAGFNEDWNRIVGMRRDPALGPDALSSAIPSFVSRDEAELVIVDGDNVMPTTADGVWLLRQSRHIFWSGYISRREFDYFYSVEAHRGELFDSFRDAARRRWLLASAVIGALIAFAVYRMM